MTREEIKPLLQMQNEYNTLKKDLRTCQELLVKYNLGLSKKGVEELVIAFEKKLVETVAGFKQIVREPRYSREDIFLCFRKYIEPNLLDYFPEEELSQRLLNKDKTQLMITFMPKSESEKLFFAKYQEDRFYAAALFSEQETIEMKSNIENGLRTFGTVKFISTGNNFYLPPSPFNEEMGKPYDEYDIDISEIIHLWDFIEEEKEIFKSSSETI